MIVNGNKIAEIIQKQVALKIATLMKQNKIVAPPKIGFILIGDSAASISYVKKKMMVSKQLGISAQLFQFAQNCEEDQIIQQIDILNEDYSYDGVLVQVYFEFFLYLLILQLPLSKNLNKNRIINQIDYKKDVDCLNSINLQTLLINGEQQETLPCTPAGVIQILDFYNVDVRGLNVTIIGRSHLVGYPLSVLLMLRNATVTICHKQTKNLEEHIRNADILISAAGVRHLINGDWIKQGSIVIDIGINQALPTDRCKIIGDVDFQRALQRCSLITPVPGGVGPMTIARLMVNLQNLWCKKYGFPITKSNLPHDYLQD